MKHFFIGLALLISLVVQAQLKSPAQFLPGYGRQVTYHYQVENYFSYLVQNSAYIQHKPYGQTNEERGLNAYYISTPQNLKDLENIRQNHLYQIGLAA